MAALQEVRGRLFGIVNPPSPSIGMSTKPGQLQMLRCRRRITCTIGRGTNPQSSLERCSMKRFRTVARAALMCALALWPTVGYSSERRCQELASDCVCSEPLNNSDTYTTNVYRPSDSEGSRCGYWSASQAAHGTSSFPVRFPAGATATHVL